MIRTTDLVFTAALTLAMSAMAAAQTPITQTPTAQAPTAAATTGETRSSWLASGFVGSTFGTTTEHFALDGGGSIDFGGQIAYLFRGTVGAEFLADFAPNVGDNVLFASEPKVNSYMGNIVAAMPLGASGRYQPYMSGGAGIIRLNVDLFEDVAAVANTTVRSHNTKGGGNIGGGFMAFADRFGVRADIRYYKAFSDSNPPAPFIGGDTISHLVLDGLGFWRGNFGLAIRW